MNEPVTVTEPLGTPRVASQYSEITRAHASGQATGSSAQRSPTACGAEPSDVDTAAHLRLNAPLDVAL